METFPIKYLTQAYNLLCFYGHDKFRKFVNDVSMPQEDIDRVLSKHAYNNNKEYKKEVDNKINKIKQIMEKWGK